MPSDVGVRLGVDGEKAFKDSLKAVNSQIKALGAEMTSVTASFLEMPAPSRRWRRRMQF